MMSIIQSIFLNVAPFFILLGLLIFVHELGHFLVARYFGVRVEVFSLGFGKKLWSHKRGDTTYALSVIPLGGYVKMYGDDPTSEVPVAERTYAFLHKPVAQRIAIVLAGPLMNLFFALFLFIVIAGVGEEVPGPFTGDVAQGTPAYEAGFRSGDKIVKINGEDTPTWLQVRKTIEQLGGKAAEFVVERKGEAQPLTLQASASFGENENIFSSQRQVGRIEGLSQESRSTVVGVVPGGPAAKAGVNALDIVETVNGQKISYWRDLVPTLTAAAAAGPVKLGVRELKDDGSQGEVRELTLDLGTLPEGADVLATAGFESPELYILSVKKKTPAATAGIQKGDKVVRINGEEMKAWSEVLAKVKGYSAESEALEFTLLRAGQEVSVKLKPEMTEIPTMKGQMDKRFTIGVISGLIPIGAESVFHRITNPVAMVKNGIKDTLTWSEFVVMSLVRLVQGEVSPKNIGGVLTIGRVASHSFAAGISAFLRTMAIISINLFLLNLLPIPVLDGGHLVFYSVEALKGTPLSMRKMELAQQIGLMLLMFLMVFAFYNDVTNWFFNRW